MMAGRPHCAWGPPGPVLRYRAPKGRGTARPATTGRQPNTARPAERFADYSRSSAYEPMARAMSAWAQNRWYVNEGAAPPARYASIFDQAGSFL